MLSIVLPVFNEMQHNYLHKIARNLEGIDDLEKIAVDGGSSDGTVDFLKTSGFRVLSLKNSSRFARIRLGLERSSGQVILLHHPRSVLEVEAYQWLCKINDFSGWGGFTHSFDHEHPVLRFTSWYSNFIRPRKGILYLDHCIYFSAKEKDIVANCEDVEIFEDTNISVALSSKLGSPRVSPYISTTSAVRFLKNGIFKQALLNQKMKIQYLMGRSHSKMNKTYEKGLGLNNQ